MIQLLRSFDDPVHLTINGASRYTRDLRQALMIKQITVITKKNTGCKIQDAGCGIHDTRYKIQDARCRIHDTGNSKELEKTRQELISESTELMNIFGAILQKSQ